MESAGVSLHPPTDALLSWFRSEFTAANAIIDALCYHIRVVASSDRQPEYDQVFAAIHRRRMNWIPILHAQTYFSIAEVVLALRNAAVAQGADEETGKWKRAAEEMLDVEQTNTGVIDQAVGKEAVGDEEEKRIEAVAAEEVDKEEEKEEIWASASSLEKRPTPDERMGLQTEILALEKDDAASGSLGISVLGFSSPNAVEDFHFFSQHDDRNERLERVRTTKGFTAKEPVDGHIVNVVRGLKLFDNIFIDIELSKLVSIANELRVAGQKGELSGETYISFNKQLKGSRREMIQLGITIFGQKQDKPSHVEPIPAAYEAAINRLVLWHLIPESRKPNCCIINFFDEGECSQPYLRPPHIEQPISTLSLSSDCNMVFGRILMTDRHGNYKGSLELPLNEGSLVVMRGNSANTTHAICPSPSKRITVTFVKVCTETSHRTRPTMSSRKPLLARRMTLWQVGGFQEKDFSCKVADNSRECHAVAGVPKWGFLHVPSVSAAPRLPLVMQRRRPSPAGTGVFIPSKTDAIPRDGFRLSREAENSDDNASG